MKIIFIGDIIGKNARDDLIKIIPDLQSKYQSDLIICNAENAAAGYGLTKKIALDLFDNGINAITLGNHAWDQREMLSYIEECPKIIRAINYPPNVPGKGFVEIILEDGRRLILMQVMLRLFMNMQIDDPFASITKRLSSEYLGTTCNGILIDLHGETTSEKNAFAHISDGKVTAILGTHTHVPTSDARLLENSTAYQTDVGMTGNYNSVIGMDKAGPIHAFTKGYRDGGRFTPAIGKGKVCGTFIESNDKTGLARNIETFQI